MLRDKIHFLSTMLELGGQAGLRQTSLVLSPLPQNGAHCSEDGLENCIYISGAIFRNCFVQLRITKLCLAHKSIFIERMSQLLHK